MFTQQTVRLFDGQEIYYPTLNKDKFDTWIDDLPTFDKLKDKIKTKKTFSKSGDRVFELDIRQGKSRFRRGKITFVNGDILEGDFDNIIPGKTLLIKGKMTFKNGDIHEGEFDTRQGRSLLIRGKRTFKEPNIENIKRTKKMKKRKSSYRWHYDNNPQEIRKNIIYLTDVGELNSPFEYLSKPNGEGLLMESTRTGPDNWRDAPNGSRIDKEVKKLIKKEGYYTQKFIAKKGSIGSFINDIAHRANPVLEGFRDVVNIRVKPAMEKPPKYIDEKWTSDTSSSGVVNPDPLVSWNTT